MYEIKQLDQSSDIFSCPQFSIQYYNWGGDYRPHSYGSVGLLKKEGLLIRLCSEESSPLCTYTEPNDMVYKDSALEAFLQLDPEHTDSYINLELNASGVLRAQFGKTRENRLFFTLEQINHCHIEHGKVKTSQGKDCWWVQILLPFSVIEDFYGNINLCGGTHIRCNFFKISESKSIEHYGSFAPIEHPTPNFHLPEFFADAVIGT